MENRQMRATVERKQIMRNRSHDETLGAWWKVGEKDLWTCGSKPIHPFSSDDQQPRRLSPLISPPDWISNAFGRSLNIELRCAAFLEGCHDPGYPCRRHYVQAIGEGVETPRAEDPSYFLRWIPDS